MKYLSLVLILGLTACESEEPRTPVPPKTYEVVCPLTINETFRDTITTAASYYYTRDNLHFSQGLAATGIQYPKTCVVKEITDEVR